MTLTAEQLSFVDRVDLGGPAFAVAVAGAGKTTTICAAVQRMIVRGSAPSDILVATFSKPGCADMRARAAKIGVPYGVNWRTMHSCGWSIAGDLADLGKETPERRDPVLVDPRGSNSWWVKKLLRDYLRERAKGQPDNLKETILKMSGIVLSEIGLASAHLIWPESWTTADGDEFPAYIDWAQDREREPADALTADITQGFFSLWEEVKAEPELRGFDAPKDRRMPRPLLPGATRKKRSPRKLVKWFSYDDMIAWPARWILEGRKFTRTYDSVFKWVIVDEAQDNNLAQNVLAEHLARDEGNGLNLFMVGDDQQSIYAFRGSQPALLRVFRDKHDIEQVQFTANFRCAARILDVGNGILSQAEDRLYEGELRVGRTDDAAQGGTVTATQYDSADHEAECVLDGIVEAIENGISPDDIAVLYRLNAQSGPFEIAAMKRGVLYNVAGGKFFDRPEVKTTVAFLAAAHDEDCEDAWKRVTRSIVRGLGPKFLERFPTLALARKAARKRGLNSGWRDALSNLLPILDRVQDELSAESDSLIGALGYLTGDEAGIRAFYRDEAAGEDDETEVDVALNALVECAESLGDVGSLLSYAGSTAGKGTVERQHEPRITLSTVHKAKGMEWTYVAAPGWTKGVFPFFKAPLAEERRLGYVCATRARQYLHVSWTATDVYGRPAGPSQLVQDSDVVEVAGRCEPVTWASEGTEGQPEVGVTPAWGRSIGG